MKTYAKKFNAQRAAKGAGHNLDEVEIIKAKDGFMWRVKKQPRPVADARNAKLERPADGAKYSTAQKRPLGKRAQIEADARAGKLPAPPDFSAVDRRNLPEGAPQRPQAIDGKVKAFLDQPVEGGWPCRLNGEIKRRTDSLPSGLTRGSSASSRTTTPSSAWSARS